MGSFEGAITKSALFLSVFGVRVFFACLVEVIWGRLMGEGGAEGQKVCACGFI